MAIVWHQQHWPQQPLTLPVAVTARRLWAALCVRVSTCACSMRRACICSGAANLRPRRSSPWVLWQPQAPRASLLPQVRACVCVCVCVCGPLALSPSLPFFMLVC